MVWAILVAVGVAVVSATLFAARLTRRTTSDEIVEHLEIATDPNDPWAAWKPRSFDEVDRPRPRVWPVLAAITGLVMVGAGFAGARQTLWAQTAEPAAAGTDGAAPQPYTVEVDIPATPTPKPTPTPPPPTPKPTVRPAATQAPPASTAPAASTAPSATPNGMAPSLSGGASCDGGTLRASYNASSAEGLKWVSVYVDGALKKGGPISGTSHSGSYQQPSTPGPHDLEVAVEDKSGQTTRRQYQATCG